MRVGYVRCGVDGPSAFTEPSTERQRRALVAYGCDEVVVEGPMHGELASALSRLGEGDELVAYRADRFGSDPLDGMHVLSECRRRGARLVLLDMGDMSTDVNKRLMFHSMLAFVEFVGSDEHWAA